ncbi:ABC transporter G family member 9-like [Stylophora pistillata]|uniref:ABC transporter G family member 9-like n=1 Tax=Stylophora pistillata TaxID=50429 RepID=UPI000C0500EA|nr:ABC transporter G family member 9-like [Stylophora pistillata]
MSEEVEANVPVFLSFNSLGVKIGDREILRNVSGKVHPGELLAVMGPSGSGKTTLLNILAGRMSPESGEILLNGTQLNKKLKKVICYVLQEDIFFANLTLRETLTFSAMLRLPDALSKAEKLQKVDQIVDNLDIRKCLDTKIGSPFERGLSGGEKKRANIGSELITNPSLIYLDEPTSGLDSSNALNLVKTLKSFAAREKKTVVTTIHQPSSQIFYMFDKVLLLCGGQVAYYGKASRVLDFFESVGLVCDAHFNPADFILEKVTEGEEIQERIVQGWAERQKRRQKYPAISTEHGPRRSDTPSPIPQNDDKDRSQNMPNETSPKDGQQKATEELKNKEYVSGHCTTDDPEKENETSPPADRSSESTEEMVAADCLNEQEDVLRLEDEGGFSSVEMLEEEKERRSGNGHVPSGGDELPSGTSESSNLLASNPKPSVSKTLWRNVRDSFTKSSDHLPQVHSEVLVPAADVNVAVVSYKRSTSRDYFKVDVHDDDEDHSALYSDISTSWATSFWTQFTVLLLRTFKQSKPDILSKLDLAQNLLLALISGLIWFQLPYKEQSIEDRYSLLFFVVVYWMFSPLFQALLSFPSERSVVNKERAAGYYRLSAYYLAKLCSELPLVLCQPTLFYTAVYWMTGLNRSEAFLGNLFVLLLTAITGQSVGLCIGATVMNFKKSVVVCAVYGLTCMLLGGFYQKNIPSWLSWFQYTAFLKYSYEASLAIEFGNSPSFSCSTIDSSYGRCQNNGTSIEGTDILERLNVTRSVGENIAVLLCFIVIFRILTYLSLRYLQKPK